MVDCVHIKISKACVRFSFSMSSATIVVELKNLAFTQIKVQNHS